MHIFGRELFSQAKKRYERLLVAQYAYLPGTLRDSGAAGAKAAGEIDEVLAGLGNVTASRLLEMATPFFWLNVQRCYASALQGTADLPRHGRALLITAFDSFLPLLPAGATVEVGCDEPCDLFLPRQRARIPAAENPRTLRRAGPEGFEVTVGRGVLRFDGATARAEGCEDPTVAIPGPWKGRILRAPGAALIEEDVLDEPLPWSCDVSAFAEMLGDSLSLIAKVDKDLGDAIEELVSWYVPIHTPSLDVHRSFTSDALNGVLFLSEASNHVILAEAVVHELYHNVLNMVMATEEVFKAGDAAELYYSPWRDDPRPLFGLFHALYVFSGVTDLYARAAAVVEDSELSEVVRQKRAKLSQQLRMGVAQVPSERLTELGRRVLQQIADGLERDRRAASPLDEGAAAAAEEHMVAWCLRNPELAAGARRPGPW